MKDRKKEKIGENSYQSILYTSYPIPLLRKRMSKESRAAQFAPFAALKGYEEMLEEDNPSPFSAPVRTV